MSTSGSSDFNVTRNEIIRAAAVLIGAVKASATLSSLIVSDFALALNAMVKRWAAKGLHVWTVAEATLFLLEDQTSYVLSTASTSDHATESFVETTLSAAAASGAATFAVTSATGISAAMYIGIELDSGTFQFTTVTSIASTTVTPAAVLTGAAASGNRVVAYTSKIVRPLKIVSARRYNFDDARDTPISIVARKDYYDLANKMQNGAVTQIFYDPRGGANATGMLKVYQSPDNVDDAIKFTWHRPIQDFDTSSDNPDLPQEWIDTLIYNLALVKAVEFDVPDSKFVKIKTLADQFLDDVSGFDREAEPIQFSPFGDD